MEPMTMMMIAQAGYQVYSMTRSGGGGVGQLLAAQTRMLAEIQEQVSLINKKLDLVYKKIDELKDDVRELPKKTAREFIEYNMQGLFIGAGDVLNTFMKHLNQRGRAYAIYMVREESADLLYKIRDHRSTLIADGSETLCPIVALAWYIELQIRGTCIDFDENRIVSSAEIYKKAFEDWITIIESTLKENEQIAQKMVESINKSIEFNNYSCYYGIETRHKERYSNRGETRTDEYKLRAWQSTLSVEPSSVREKLSSYVSVLDILSSEGVSIDSSFSKINPFNWQSRPIRFRQDFIVQDFNESEKKKYDRMKRTLKNSECKRPSNFADEFANKENENNVLSEKLLLKTIVYSNFLLVCREALRSINALIDRSKKTEQI